MFLTLMDHLLSSRRNIDGWFPCSVCRSLTCDTSAFQITNSRFCADFQIFQHAAEQPTANIRTSYATQSLMSSCAHVGCKELLLFGNLVAEPSVTRGYSSVTVSQSAAVASFDGGLIFLLEIVHNC